MSRVCVTAFLAVFAFSEIEAVEVTVANDSLTDFGTATIVTGFAAGEQAASWLTSPCEGNVRAVQVFWRSLNGTSGATLQASIDIRRGGAFPEPGVVAQTIGGPVLNDNVLNEWRFIDENNLIPINVPVTEDETFVVSLRFDTAPPPSIGPSVVRDNDGILPSRNAIHANVGGTFFWFDSAFFGLTGDWVIRAVVDCPVVAQEADVSVAMSAAPDNYVPGTALDYTLVVSNDGPSAAPGTTVVDFFPPALSGVTWTCAGSGGSTCAPAGTGNLAQLVNLAAGGSVQFDISGTVLPGTTGTISNSVTAVVAGGITDPDPANNTVTVNSLPVPEADVSVALSADPSSYIAGAALGYTLVVSNAGPAAAPNTTVVDLFPAALTGVSWTCSGNNGATCPASGVGNVSLQVNLPAGSDVVFEVEGIVAGGTTAVLTNSATAVVSVAVVDPVPANNTASIDTPRLLQADVGVSLAVDPTSYVAGQPLYVSVTVDNAGPDAAPAALVSTNLPAVYTGATWTCLALGGASCPASGSGSLAQAVSLPAGGSVVFALAGGIDAGTTGPLQVGASVAAGAGLSDPVAANDSDSVEVPEGSLVLQIFADGFEP